MDQIQLFLHANKHQLGYIMNEASRIWNEYVPGGAFTVGECYGIVKHYGTYDELLKKNDRLQNQLHVYQVVDNHVREQSKKVRHIFPLENVAGYGQLCDKVLEYENALSIADKKISRLLDCD